jgi:hypothetical protein
VNTSPRSRSEIRAVTDLNDWTWLRLPVRVGRWSLPLCGVLLDGFYLSAWPLVGAFVLPIVFWIGLRLGWEQAAGAVLYIYSFAAMVVLVLISQHSAAVGFALWLGYALGDLVYFLPAIKWAVFQARALADLVLGLLLVITPLVTRALTRSGVRALVSSVPALAAASRDERFALTVCIQAFGEFWFVYLWMQAAGLLLQPFYVWQGAGPMTHGLIVTLRGLGTPLGLVAAYVGGVRIGLEALAATRPALSARKRSLREALLGVTVRYRFAYGLLLVPFRALLLTFLLSGLIDQSRQHAVTVFVAVAVVLLIREIALGYLGLRAEFLARIPVVVRFLAALIVGYSASTYIVRSMGGGTFVDGLTSAVVSVVVFAVLLPGPLRMTRRGAQAGAAK